MIKKHKKKIGFLTEMTTTQGETVVPVLTEKIATLTENVDQTTLLP